SKGTQGVSDEQKLVAQFPFLVTAGEIRMNAGSKTVFKLAGVEGQEHRSMGKLGGSTQSTQGQVPQLGVASTSGSHSDPTVKQDDEASSSLTSV
ncbi:MAG: hypothetical protein HY711_09005, partial [Candidatus Melainabacteria bacterium]|nr:hypothetical protein [Candidatus Melainabacteria bacterium]